MLAPSDYVQPSGGGAKVEERGDPWEGISKPEFYEIVNPNTGELHPGASETILELINEVETRNAHDGSPLEGKRGLVVWLGLLTTVPHTRIWEIVDKLVANDVFSLYLLTMCDLEDLVAFLERSFIAKAVFKAGRAYKDYISAAHPPPPTANGQTSTLTQRSAPTDTIPGTQTSMSTATATQTSSAVSPPSDIVITDNVSVESPLPVTPAASSTPEVAGVRAQATVEKDASTTAPMKRGIESVKREEHEEERGGDVEQVEVEHEEPRSVRKKGKRRRVSFTPESAGRKGGGRAAASANHTGNHNGRALRSAIHLNAEGLIALINTINDDVKIEPGSPLEELPGGPHASAVHGLLTILSQRSHTIEVVQAAVTRLRWLMQLDSDDAVKERAMKLVGMNVGNAIADLLIIEVWDQRVQQTGRVFKQRQPATGGFVASALKTAAHIFGQSPSVPKELRLCRAVQKAMRKFDEHVDVQKTGLQVINELGRNMDNARAMISDHMSSEICHALELRNRDIIDYGFSALSGLGDHMIGGEAAVDLLTLGEGEICQQVVDIMLHEKRLSAATRQYGIGVVMVMCREKELTAKFGDAGACKFILRDLAMHASKLKGKVDAEDYQQTELLVCAVQNLAGECPENQSRLGRNGALSPLVSIITTVCGEDRSENVASVGAGALWALTADDEGNRSELGHLGVCEWAVREMSRNEGCPWVHESLLGLTANLASLAKNDYQNWRRVVEAGACERVPEVMLKYGGQQGLQEEGCHVIAVLSCGSTAAARLRATRACEALTTAVKTYPSNSDLLEHAITAMMNLMRGQPDEVAKLKSLGAAAVVGSAMGRLRGQDKERMQPRAQELVSVLEGQQVQVKTEA